jgi:hypothetical protein
MEPENEPRNIIHIYKLRIAVDASDKTVPTKIDVNLNDFEFKGELNSLPEAIAEFLDSLIETNERGSE